MREGSQPLPVKATKFAGTALLLLASALFPKAAPAQPHANRTYLGQDIFVAPGQQIGNATCIFCSVQIEGDLSGNVLVLFGNLTVTGHVAGNTTVIGGNTVIDSQARITGRTTVVDGNAVYETDDSLSGNAYVLGGHISSFAGRASPHHRVALSPTKFTAIAIITILLLAALLFPRSRHHAPTS